MMAQAGRLLQLLRLAGLPVQNSGPPAFCADMQARRAGEAQRLARFYKIVARVALARQPDAALCG